MKKNKNVSSPAVQGKSRRWVWVTLAVILVIAAAVLTWYLMRYQFYNEYKQYITAPEAALQGTEFTALPDASPDVKGYELAAENDILKLYAKVKTGEVAVYEKRIGNTVYSNPPEAGSDKVANKTNKNYLKAQFLVEYFNAGLTSNTYDSFTKCVDLDNLKAESISDGVRFIYEVGDVVEVYYVPHLLSDERFQQLYGGAAANVQKLMTGQANSFYAQDAEGNWRITEWQFMTGGQWVSHPGGDGVECTVPAERIEERGGGMVAKIQLLPYMGAASAAENGCLVVPNGSGAVINFNNGKTATRPTASMSTTWTWWTRNIPRPRAPSPCGCPSLPSAGRIRPSWRRLKRARPWQRSLRMFPAVTTPTTTPSLPSSCAATRSSPCSARVKRRICPSSRTTSMQRP